jgi:hypothetical protein
LVLHRKSVRAAISIAAILCCTRGVRAASAFACASDGPFPTLARPEGITELTGDVLIYCYGGTPTPAGAPVPTATIQVFLDTHITSRLLLNGWSEALLMIDDPLPFKQRVCGTDGDVLSGPGRCTITGTGTGVGVYDGSPGRPTVFQGQQAGVNSIVWTGVPVDPPGSSGSRLIRITNLRADAVAIGPPPSDEAFPNPITSTFVFTGTAPLPSINLQVLVAYVPFLLSSSADAPKQCAPGGSRLAALLGKHVSQATVHARAASSFSFKTRTSSAFIDNNTSPPPADSDNPGVSYASETGFFNSVFPKLDGRGDLAEAGLADQGTRIFVRIEGVPSGVALYSPVVVSRPATPYDKAEVARRIETTSNGGGRFRPTPANSAGLARLDNNGGAAIAVYEVLSANCFLCLGQFRLNQMDIPIYAAFDGASPATLGSAAAGHAPFSTETNASLTAAVPRFTELSSPTLTLVPTVCTQ